jgi:transposase
VLCGILFVVPTGVQWEFLPSSSASVSGMTCWRGLEEWNTAGVRTCLHQLLLQELHKAGKLDWSRAVIDSAHARALRRGPNRTEPGRPCQTRLEAQRSSRRRRIPLAANLYGGNRDDITQLEPILEAIPPVQGRRGRPRRDLTKCSVIVLATTINTAGSCAAKGIRPHIARRGVLHGSDLGVYRWVAERTIAWRHGMKRLRIRWERRDDIHEAFLAIATCIITYRHAHRLC